MVYELMWSQEPRTLGLCLLIEDVLQGRRVAVADAANSMDPYVLARVAHRQRLDRRLLSRVIVSRAFTCHQLEELLRDRLDRVETDRVLVIDPGALLYDEEVGLGEALRVARLIARHLERFDKAPVAVTMSEPPRPRAGVFEIFYDHAKDVVYESVQLKGGPSSAFRSGGYGGSSEALRLQSEGGRYGKDGPDVQSDSALGAGRAAEVPPSLASGGAGGF